MAYKTWNVGDVLTAAEMNTYVRDQGTVLCTSTTRPTGTLTTGLHIYETDTKREYVWDGTAWATGPAPLGTLGYAQVTANQGSITTAVDLTGLSQAVTVGTGRRIRITGYVASASSTVANDYINLAILEGATQLESGSVAPQTATFGLSVSAQVVITPTAGAHTYKLQMSRAAGTGTITMGAGASFPAFIHVEDCGV